MTARVLEGDVRVSTEEVQDATMEDIGGKDPPPGDPPDKRGSWVRRVVGTMAGGMPIPEEIMDEGFVDERLTLEFPNGEDGEPVITIGEEVLNVMNEMWKRCMIVKVLGRTVSIASLNRKLRELWKPKGSMYVMDLPRQFFMVRFELEEEYMAALSGGPWRMFGSYLMVQAWNPQFDPLRDDIVTTPVWVRLSNLPVNFYHRAILMGIARGLGEPIKVDLTTLKFERGRFARVCVEVNLNKPLKGSVMINGERYFVAYEGIAAICSSCGMYGHLVHACPKKAVDKVLVLPAPESRTDTSNTPVAMEEEFTQVRQSGRRAGSHTNSGLDGRGSRGNEKGGSSREVSKGKEVDIVQVSNKFGTLVELTEGQAEVEEGETADGNKENEKPLNARVGHKGDVAGNNIVFGASMGVGVSRVNHVVSREKKVINQRGSVPLKPKARANGPMRVLVFGPVRGESEVAANGKRPRVERDSSGRMGTGDESYSERFKMSDAGSVEKDGQDSSGQIGGSQGTGLNHLISTGNLIGGDEVLNPTELGVTTEVREA